MRFEELTIEGRNAVLEAFRSGKTIDKLFVLDGCQDGPVKTITREARKQTVSKIPTIWGQSSGPRIRRAHTALLSRRDGQWDLHLQWLRHRLGPSIIHRSQR